MALFTEFEENNCISIYKLGDNITYHSRKVSKNIQFDLFLISPNESAVMGMRSELAASFPCAIFMHETYSLHKDGGFANELNQL